MKRFYVITNLQKDPDMLMAGQIRQYLEQKGAQCFLQECDRDEVCKNYHYTDPTKIPEDIDCAIVLGGDGTVLQASRDLVDKNIPLFGINMGTLGYLAEVDKEHMEPALDKLLLDEYITEKRMMLEGSAYHLHKRLIRDVALNDIVIARNGGIRIMDFLIYVNDRLLNSYSADGIIVSTPTGSTGYSLSVGGPIVEPSASLLMITPIAPHTLNARSVILPEDAKVKIVIGERNGAAAEAEVTFDGDTAVKMSGKDYVEIEKSQKTARFVKIDQISFLEILRRKMRGT